MGAAQELEHIVLEAIEADKSVEWALANGWEVIVGGIGASNAVEEEAGPEAAPAVLVTDIAGGLLVIVLTAIILVLLVVLILLVLVAKLIPPIPGVGAKMGDMLAAVVTTVRKALEAVVAKVEATAKDAWLAARNLFRLWLRFEDVASGSEQRIQQQDVRTIRAQVHGINATLYDSKTGVMIRLRNAEHDLGYMNREFNRVWTQLNTLSGSSAADVHGQLHHIQGSIHNLWRAIQTVEHAVYLLQHPEPAPQHGKVPTEQQVQHLQHEFNSLSARLYKIETAPAPTVRMNPKDQHELTRAFDVSSVLAPLAGLAPFTAARLANLRALENDPCQCPTIGGLPNPITAAVIADFILKDGF